MAEVDGHGHFAAGAPGIAGDYCVKDSIEDFHREFPNIKINVLMPFVASIDGGKTFDEFIAKNDYITCYEKV